MQVKYVGKLADNIAALVMLALFSYMAWESMGFESKARLAPLFISLSCAGFMLIELVVQNVELVTERSLERARQKAVATPLSEVEYEEASSPPILHSSMRSMAVVLLPFFVGALLLGLLPAAFLYIFGYVRFIAKAPIAVAVGYAAGTFIVVRLLFVDALGVNMYDGILGLWIPYISG